VKGVAVLANDQFHLMPIQAYYSLRATSPSIMNEPANAVALDTLTEARNSGKRRRSPPHPGLSVRHDCLEPLGLARLLAVP